jgi:hypothetical protein
VGDPDTAQKPVNIISSSSGEREAARSRMKELHRWEAAFRLPNRKMLLYSRWRSWMDVGAHEETTTESRPTRRIHRGKPEAAAPWVERIVF